MAFSTSAVYPFNSLSTGPFSVIIPPLPSPPKMVSVFGKPMTPYSVINVSLVSKMMDELPFQLDLKGRPGGSITIQIDSASQTQVAGQVIANNLGPTDLINTKFIVNDQAQPEVVPIVIV